MELSYSEPIPEGFLVRSKMTSELIIMLVREKGSQTSIVDGIHWLGAALASSRTMLRYMRSVICFWYGVMGPSSVSPIAASDLR